MNRVKAKVAIPIGLDNVYVAKLTADVAGGKTTYEVPEYAARAIKVAMTPVTKTGTLESDDAVEIDQTVITGYTVSLEESQLDDYMRALIFGHRIDKSGGLVINKTDTPPELALLCRSKLSDEKNYKYMVLYKGSFKKNVEEYETDKRDTTTYKTETVEGTFYARESDGNIKYDLRSDSTAAGAAEKIKAWFTAVPEPDAENLAQAAANVSVPTDKK